ncbi:MAG: 4Fe-4S binding protein [Firmicutes bacterium]|nr:4Fe-4S binding protein [Bacillota bacterium]
MIRKIVKIDRQKCNGCGLCVRTCHEGAIALVDGKAALTREASCDGLGYCLPACPAGAISFEEREAPPCCKVEPGPQRQWPVQLRLAPAQAPHYANAHLLIAADCTAYTRESFHSDFLRERVALVGCPKLDSVDYSEKLAAIFTQNDPASVTLVRMLVPCCGGLEVAVKRAIAASRKKLPLRIVTLSTGGEIINERSIRSAQ